MRRFTWATVVLAGILSSDPAFGAVAVINPLKDSTIYEPEAAASNGAGALFSGRTGSAGGNTTRRALMAFDIAAAVPAGSTIEDVTLTLTVTQKSRDSSSADNYLLFPLTKNWGEGTTVGGGSGGAAANGDTTWTSNFFNTSNWDNPGGDFLATASGSIGMDAPATYTSGSTALMVSNVQSWLDNPSTNYGWMLIAQDEAANSARIISSKETGGANQPTLTVTYSVPEPGGLAALLLASALLWRRR